VKRLLLAISVGLALPAGAQCVLAGLDRPVTGAIRSPALTANVPLRRTVDAIAFVGGYGPFIAAPVMLATDRHADIGRDAVQALIISSVVTGGFKALIGRARPYVSADTMPCDFRWGRGLRRDDYRSMPSGHTSAAFTFAATLAAHSSGRGARPLLYGGATLVGVSRIYQANHWASDVLFGAAVGIAAGWAVTR